MVRIFFFWVITLLLISPAATAQELKTGDTLPDILLRDMSQSQPFTLSSLNKKLVVLQFWNTLCKGCIRSFPKVDSLQNKFNTDVEFIFVSKENSSELQAFFNLRRKIRKPSVKFISGDTLLNRYFPHQFVPHHVWLENGKKVLAITSGINSSERTIRDYLNTARADVAPIKKQYIYDWRKPAIISTIDAPWQPYAGYAYLMPSIDTAYFTFGAESTTGTGRHNRIMVNKAPMLRLFVEAFNEGGKYQFERNANNLLLKLKERAGLLQPEDKSRFEDWSRTHTFSYELMVPPADATNLYKIMQKDLQQRFKVKAAIKRIKSDCMCIVKGNGPNLYASKGGVPRHGNMISRSDTVFRFQNVDMNSVVRRLQFFSRFTPYHLANHTGFKGTVDLDFSRSLFDVFDYGVLAADLERHGLKLVKRSCEAEILVISD